MMLGVRPQAKGAKLLGEYKREGNLIHPLVIDNVTPDMRIAWEEPFGPVLPILRIDKPDDGVAHCNANRVALQAGTGRKAPCIAFFLWFCFAQP